MKWAADVTTLNSLVTMANALITFSDAMESTIAVTDQMRKTALVTGKSEEEILVEETLDLLISSTETATRLATLMNGNVSVVNVSVAPDNAMGSMIVMMNPMKLNALNTSVEVETSAVVN